MEIGYPFPFQWFNGTVLFREIKKPHIGEAYFRDPAGTRTQDPYIKSVLLYQLSYGIQRLCETWRKDSSFLLFANFFGNFFEVFFPIAS